ncbi:MAG TPA: urea ABC transporter permease subunit UrtC [Chloroflexota bacterium]|jgi:urea transport system permease protein
MLGLAPRQSAARLDLPPVALLAAVLALAGAPLLLSDFRLALLGKFLCFAIVALGLDLIWGYGGMLSLGHGFFFGLGAYAVAMYMKLEDAAGGLPDFMAWSGLRALPWFWAPFGSPAVAFGAALIAPAALAGLLGYLVFRSRITGVYFSLITQALSLIATILIVGQQPYTGGTNGMTNFSTLLGRPLGDADVQRWLYLATAASLVGAYLFCRWLTGSRFGRLLVAIQDDEARVRFSGYDPAVVKALVLALSGGLAGLAGALFVPQVGIISPALMGIVPSIEMVVWVAVGGRGTLIGAVLGALLVNAARSGLSESFPDVWQYFLGALFVGAVLLFPDGLLGFLARAPRPAFRAPPATATEPALPRVAASEGAE